MTAGGRFRGSRAHPTVLPGRTPAASAPVPAVVWTESFNGVDGATVGPDLTWAINPQGGGSPYATDTSAHLISGELGVEIGTGSFHATDYQAVAMNELPSGSPHWWGEIVFGNMNLSGAQGSSINLRFGVDPLTFAGSDDIANLQLSFDATTMFVGVWDQNDSSLLYSDTFALPVRGDRIRLESSNVTGTEVTLNGVVILSDPTILTQPLWTGAGTGLFIDFTFNGTLAHAAGAVSIDVLSYGGYNP